MDQVEIGKFIQSCRKAKNMTQRELAEKLKISDKTLSKWENGNYMPDITVLPELCRSLDISVNELISGEYLPQEKYSSKAEENIMDLLKTNEGKRSGIMTQLVMGTLLGGMGLFFLVVNTKFGWRDYLDLLSLMEVLLFTAACTFFCRPQSSRIFFRLADKSVLPIGGIVSLLQMTNIFLLQDDPIIWWRYLFYSMYPLLYAFIIHVLLLIIVEKDEKGETGR